MKKLFILFLFSTSGFLLSQENNVPIVPDFSTSKIFDDGLEQEATFSKGNVVQYISQFIEFTDKALENSVGGNILIRFVVERDGGVYDVKIIGHKLGYGLDEIAINAVKKTNKLWNPAKVNGETVRSYFRLPITFRLPPKPEIIPQEEKQ